MYIITKGEAMYYFDDSRMNTMLDDVQAELADGNYQGACNEFIDSVQYYHSVGKSTGNSTYNNVKIQDEPLTLADRFLKVCTPERCLHLRWEHLRQVRALLSVINTVRTARVRVMTLLKTAH